jgi:hypothetical protein
MFGKGYPESSHRFEAANHAPGMGLKEPGIQGNVW